MRHSTFTLALAFLPSVAAAQQWPTVSGQITVQTPAPPPPPQVVVQAPPPPPPPQVVMQAPPPPPPPQVVMQAPPPRLGYNMVYGPEPVTSGARVQLVVGQTVNGMALGFTLVGAFGANGSSVFAGSMLIGGGIGATAALLGTRDGITPGQAAAINYGTAFGGLGSMFAAIGLSQEPSFNPREATGLIAGGLALGTGAGIAWASQRPLSGRVEFAASLGLWSAFLATHLYLATKAYGIRSVDSVAVLGWSSFGFMAAGLTAGVLLAPGVPVSAQRMRWINLAALGGWAVIGLSSLLLASDSGDDSARVAYSIGSIAGVAGGGLLGYFLTQGSDAYWERANDSAARRGRPTVSFAPGASGANLGASLFGTF